MNKIKLYYFWNLNQKELLENYFLPTFKQFNDNEFELIGEEFNNDHEISSFGTVGFKKVIIKKVRSVLNILNNGAQDEFFIVSDIDIQFFNSIHETILDAIKLDKDIVFQKEHSHGDEINTGFMLIKTTDTTKQFWSNILEVLETSNEGFFINEQAIANMRLNEINSGVFDNTIWNWSQGSLHNKIRLHHANCTASTNDKIEQLENVKDYIKKNPLI